MPSEPFRFIHASHLRLDEPLAGTGPLDDEARRLAEDATLRALEHIVDACLAEGVEFLLLTGETFGSGTPTLRARRALLTAFENLCEFEIQVFWEIGREELSGVDIPDNVTPIHAGEGAPIAVVRQGRVIASLVRAGCQETFPPRGEGPDREQRAAFRIGLADPVFEAARCTPTDAASAGSAVDHDDATHDYLALSATGRRVTRSLSAGIAHDPGSAQATGVHETGIHGATLIRVEADRTADLVFVPAAAVRRERILVGVERNQTCAQLAERMQLALLELEPTPVERLWIVNWQLVGSRELFEALQSGVGVEELREALNRRLATGRDIRRVDRFHFHRRPAQQPDELCEAISGWIRGGESDPVDSLVQGLDALPRPWLETVKESLPLVDRARARDDAERLSHELLLPSADSGFRQEVEQ